MSLKKQLTSPFNLPRSDQDTCPCHFFLPFHCRRVQSLTWPKQPVTTASHSAGSAILLWVLAEAASDEGQSHGRVSHGAVGNSTTCSTSCNRWKGNMRPADFSHIGNSLLPGSHDAPDSAALLHDAVRHASASLASIPNPAVGSAILGPYPQLLKGLKWYTQGSPEKGSRMVFFHGPNPLMIQTPQHRFLSYFP